MALWVGVGLWVVTGLGAVLLTVFRARGDVFGRLYEVFFFLDSVGFRLAVGPLLLLAGVVLVRGQRARRPEPETEPSGAVTDPSFLTGPTPRLDRILVVLLAAGLAFWILGGVATQVFREPLAPGSGTGVAVVGPVTGPHPVAALVEGLAFRLWVAAAVLLAARWAVSRRR